MAQANQNPNPKRYYYECQEAAFAPGSGDGWPPVIVCKHSRHARLVRIEIEEPLTCSCGLKMSKNPHPDAGKPLSLKTVGAVWVCIPCLCLNRHEWSVRSIKAEGKLVLITEALNK